MKLGLIVTVATFALLPTSMAAASDYISIYHGATTYPSLTTHASDDLEIGVYVSDDVQPADEHLYFLPGGWIYTSTYPGYTTGMIEVSVGDFEKFYTFEFLNDEVCEGTFQGSNEVSQADICKTIYY